MADTPQGQRPILIPMVELRRYTGPPSGMWLSWNPRGVASWEGRTSSLTDVPIYLMTGWGSTMFDFQIGRGNVVTIASIGWNCTRLTHKHKSTVAATNFRAWSAGDVVRLLFLYCVSWLRGCFSISEEVWVYLVLPAQIQELKALRFVFFGFSCRRLLWGSHSSQPFSGRGRTAMADTYRWTQNR